MTATSSYPVSEHAGPTNNFPHPRPVAGPSASPAGTEVDQPRVRFAASETSREPQPWARNPVGRRGVTNPIHQPRVNLDVSETNVEVQPWVVRDVRDVRDVSSSPNATFMRSRPRARRSNRRTRWRIALCHPTAPHGVAGPGLRFPARFTRSEPDPGLINFRPVRDWSIGRRPLLGSCRRKPTLTRGGEL